jgi:hypothetical protein
MGMQWEGKSFIDNLPKIYGVYTGGFLAFFALMASFETLGLSADVIGILFVAFTIGIYAFIGILSRTMAVEAYYVAGTQRAASVQRHGNGGRLDVGRVVRRDGRRHLHGRPRLHGLYRGLDWRLHPRLDADGALPAQVRLLHGAGLHRHAVRRQADALLRRSSCWWWRPSPT